MNISIGLDEGLDRIFSCGNALVPRKARCPNERVRRPLGKNPSRPQSAKQSRHLPLRRHNTSVIGRTLTCNWLSPIAIHSYIHPSASVLNVGFEHYLTRCRLQHDTPVAGCGFEDVLSDHNGNAEVSENVMGAVVRGKGIMSGG